MDSITLKAYAKINLGLDVLRKRQDGYHDVCMIMQTIDLYDTISIEKSKSLKKFSKMRKTLKASNLRIGFLKIFHKNKILGDSSTKIFIGF